MEASKSMMKGTPMLVDIVRTWKNPELMNNLSEAEGAAVRGDLVRLTELSEEEIRAVSGGNGDGISLEELQTIVDTANTPNEEGLQSDPWGNALLGGLIGGIAEGVRGVIAAVVAEVGIVRYEEVTGGGQYAYHADGTREFCPP